MSNPVIKRSARSYPCFIACAPRLEKLLAGELKALGINQFKTRRAGIDCRLGLREIYLVCLWSRAANRVLLSVGEYQIKDEKSYYDAVQQIDWSKHLSSDGSLAVDFFCSDSCITHSRYGAQLTKDAVVDWFRERYGERPGVDREAPDVRINAYLFRNKVRLSLDMSGTSLHRRNYRAAGGYAPLKENLAASVLLASRWSKSAGALYDPMCGSGTLLIEGALIAANIAPGLLRSYFGFLGWLQHDAGLWDALCIEAREQSDTTALPPIFGSDIDAGAVRAARANIQAAGLSEFISVEEADFFTLNEAVPNGPGLVVINPPYGERLEKPEDIGRFYTTLGRTLKRCCANWQLALFTGAPSLFHRMGLARRVVLECKNGDIDCRLFVASVPAAAPQSKDSGSDAAQPGPWADAMQQRENRDTARTEAHNAPGLTQFTDRLKKNLRQIRGWAKSTGASNYRVYDADLPDYAFALDVYHDADVPHEPYVCLQEYRAPAHIDSRLAQLRIDGASEVIRNELGCSENNLAVKRRDRQRAEQQYHRLERRNQFHTVSEGQCRFLINLHDYLDCGLFLDHRKVRHWLSGNTDGKRFLNLYCYTASATVHAVAGGASGSVSVDLSYKYLEWAEKNFALNNIDTMKHTLVRADCREWIDSHRQSNGEAFDVIFLDPPTFSNSSATEQDWDVQKDHESMIAQCMSILKSDGVLVFSNNFRRFKLSPSIPHQFAVEDRSRWSVQRDFSRNPKIHQCWFIRHSSAASDRSQSNVNKNRG